MNTFINNTLHLTLLIILILLFFFFVFFCRNYIVLFTCYSYKCKTSITWQTWQTTIKEILLYYHILLLSFYVLYINKYIRRTTIINERIIKEKNEFELYDIAGPLCFSGDMIATKRLMPKILEGDWLVVHDAGGYTYSMHSRYNSIPAPAVYSYRYQQSNNNEDMDDKEKIELLEFNIVKERETWEDVCKFWNS